MYRLEKAEESKENIGDNLDNNDKNIELVHDNNSDCHNTAI